METVFNRIQSGFLCAPCALCGEDQGAELEIVGGAEPLRGSGDLLPRTAQAWGRQPAPWRRALAGPIFVISTSADSGYRSGEADGRAERT
jgi:hypothetical protein